MSVNWQPVLTGRLLTLRPLREEDFPALLAVASDPLIWEQHPANDRWQEPVFRQFFRDGLASGGALVALEAAGGEVLGSSRYHGYDETARSIEIGWTFLGRKVWGGTHNREMKHLMLRHAFQYVDSVTFRVGPGNLRSQKALGKIGAVPEGSVFDPDGREHFLFRIRKQDFASYPE